jgi:colanic acid/amylovoran biosynthesis glycosyltransferase
MKIGYICTSFPCLTERFILREIRALEEEGFEITVFAAVGESNFGNLDDIEVVYRPSRVSLKGILSLLGLFGFGFAGFVKFVLLVVRLFLESRRDCFIFLSNLHTIGYFSRELASRSISHIHCCFLSWPSCIGLGVSIFSGKGLSISAHAKDIFVERGALKVKVSRASFISVCSRYGLEQLKCHLPGKYHDKLKLIRHGVRIRQESFDRKECGTIVAVGRLIEKKGFEDLLYAFASVARRRADCRLTIIGEGPERTRLESLVKRFCLCDRIRLAGSLSPEVTLSIIREASILVVPSRIAGDGDIDGICNVILEAFSHGSPVVACDVGGIGEAVEDGKTGILVKSRDCRQMAKAIERLLCDGDLRERVIRGAFEIVRRRFDTKANAISLSKLFLAVNS